MSVVLLNCYEYRIYTRNYNRKIDAIARSLREKVPELAKKDILEIVTSESSDSFLRDYGYDYRRDSYIASNEKFFKIYTSFQVSVVGGILILWSLCERRKENKRNKENSELLELLEKINSGNYELKVENMQEKTVSLLESEIYKTAIHLKTVAENDRKAKENLKSSLEDISHQLKTPMQSISINVDYALEKISKQERNVLIKVKKDVFKLQTLVGAILTLSKFDTDTIVFHRDEVELIKIIEEAIENISAIADLRSVSFSIACSREIKIYCDEVWEIEAITNILKNAVEHAKSGSTVAISYIDNKIYSSLKIENIGKTISQKDLRHIFERFYRGENAPKDSIGIGLALSNAIIGKDGGKIEVSSRADRTIFTIKYFH